MMHASFYGRARIWVRAGWRNRAVSFKAVGYALVGVVNTAWSVPGRGQHVVLDGRGQHLLHVEFDHYICRRIRAQAALVGLFHLRGVRHRGLVCQYRDTSGRRRGLAFSAVAGKAARCHGELHSEFFTLALCCVPHASQSGR